MTSNDIPNTNRILRIADLSERRDAPFQISLSPEQCDAARAQLSLLGLRKTRFEGALSPSDTGGWELRATLGATVVQPCTITLEPVTTRIDAPVLRSYVPELETPDDAETEMPEDDTLEPLPAIIDLGAILLEELALSLPLYPRAPGAELETAVFTEPGKTPMTDDDAKPFASLAEFRKGLEEDGK